MSLDWRLNNPVVTFEVVKIVSESKRGLQLELETGRGLVSVWLSRRLIRMYHYHANNRVVIEVELPEWLGKKIGLMESL